MDSGIEGVILSREKIIPTALGDIYHTVKADSHGFSGFGEAYFSSVPYLCTKDWKSHTRMTLNIVVPVGQIRFALYDSRAEGPTAGKTFSVDLSPENYFRLTVPPGVWMAFQGLGKDLNLLLNVANMSHDPDEAIREPVPNDIISYQPWVSN